MLTHTTPTNFYFIVFICFAFFPIHSIFDKLKNSFAAISYTAVQWSGFDIELCNTLLFGMCDCSPLPFHCSPLRSTAVHSCMFHAITSTWNTSVGRAMASYLDRSISLALWNVLHSPMLLKFQMWYIYVRCTWQFIVRNKNGSKQNDMRFENVCYFSKFVFL